MRGSNAAPTRRVRVAHTLRYKSPLCVLPGRARARGDTVGVTQGSRDEASSGKGITVSTQSLGEQTVDLLARLVRLGCVNDLTADSGGEERAADLLEEFFVGLPVSIERITPHPGRTTLVVTRQRRHAAHPRGAHGRRARGYGQVDA